MPFALMFLKFSYYDKLIVVARSPIFIEFGAKIAVKVLIDVSAPMDMCFFFKKADLCSLK